MTTTRKQKPAEKMVAPFGSFKGFANIELTPSTKQIIVDQAKEEGALETALNALVSSGYKVSFSFDKRSQCVQATATGTESTGPSNGYATSARSEDYTRAVVALAVKVYDVADGDLSAFAKEKVSAAEV